MKDMVIPETYKDKDGNEKISWNKIGITFEGKEGKHYAKLNHMPGILIHFFEQKPREEKGKDW